MFSISMSFCPVAGSTSPGRLRDAILCGSGGEKRFPRGFRNSLELISSRRLTMPLKILALETSGLYGSAALAEDGQLIAEATLAPPTRSAHGLAPLLDRLLRDSAWRPFDIGLVAVVDGPGSFTGLRVGLATAKLFAYATGADVLGIDAFAAIASAAPQFLDNRSASGHVNGNSLAIERLAAEPLAVESLAVERLAVEHLNIVADAQRGQLLTARWKRGATSDWNEDAPATLLDVDRWLAGLAPGDVVAGPALATGRPTLAASLSRGVFALPENFWIPTAASVARLAWRDFQAGRRDSLWSLVPRYHRPSAAEEKRAEG